MNIRDNYKIKEIPSQVALLMVKSNHYLHRGCPVEQSFGMFNILNMLVGVIIYGTPASSSLRKGVCGIEEKDNVIELTRLWIQDEVGHNAESYLIGNTIPLVKKEVIVSYADTSQNHLGIVYQATNWIYTGLSAKRKDMVVEGLKGHSITLFDKYKTVAEIKKVFGEKAYWKERPRKHRYVYLNCNKRRKKELIKKLKYPVEDYPKNYD